MLYLVAELRDTGAFNPEDLARFKTGHSTVCVCEYREVIFVNICSDFDLKWRSKNLIVIEMRCQDIY